MTEDMRTIKYCSEGHDQISYLADTCPVCRVVQEFGDIIDHLKNEIQDIKKLLESSIYKEDQKDEGTMRD